MDNKKYYSANLSRLLDAVPVSCGNCFHMKCQGENVSRKAYKGDKSTRRRLIARCKQNVMEKKFVIDRKYSGSRVLPTAWKTARTCPSFDSMMD